jgi:hypothetical protein
MMEPSEFDIKAGDAMQETDLMLKFLAFIGVMQDTGVQEISTEVLVGMIYAAADGDEGKMHGIGRAFMKLKGVA